MKDIAEKNIGISLQPMESSWLQRVWWRHRGAWLWPVFVLATLADAVLEHLRPPTSDTQSVIAAALVGLVLNLLAVLLLSRPVGVLLRRVRPDLPPAVARNYAGTSVVLAVSAVLLLAGVAHHSTVVANQNALRDATVRAQAFIGDRAPPEYRHHVDLPDTVAIEPGSIYRTCVPGRDFSHTYCVIVKTRLPFPRSVKYAGHTPNAVFAQGTG